MSKRSEVNLEQRRKQRINVALWSTFIVVVVIGFLILAKISSGGGTGSAEASPAPASVVSKLASVPASVFNAIGQGTASKLPGPINAPALTQSGKPRVLYIGAEYCPYCATERWPMVVALSRFGSFSGLKVTHSSPSDAFPNTQTLSFHGSSYTSQYLTFSGFETLSNELVGTTYAALDVLSPDDQKLENTYDAAPYVSAQSAGSIPFIDFGGKYLISGSTYDPGTLQGKSWDDIATAMSDPKSAIAQGAVGSANLITASICSLTGNQPGNVCNTSTIKGLQAKINAQPANGPK